METEKIESGTPIHDRTIRAFLEDVGSKTPSPGGGAAAASAGALGVSLLLMAGRFSLDAEHLDEYVEDLEFMSDRLLELAEEDRRTYRSYRAEVQRTNGGDDKNRVNLLLKSIQIPIDIGQCCRDVLQHYLEVRSMLKNSFQTDIRMAVGLLENSWKTTNELCEWNLEQLSDGPSKDDLSQNLEQLQNEMDSIFEEIDEV